MQAPSVQMNLCVPARGRARARANACEVGAGAGAGAGAGGAAAPPGWPEARQGSPRRRPEGRSSGFLEAECGGARGPRGGNPGLQREARPRPAPRPSPLTHPPPPPPGGAGAARAQELRRGAGAKGEGRQKAYSTRYSQAVSHPSTNQARPCLASEIRRDRARSGWYGRRRGRLPPGALRALRCACLSL